jgi:triacylglycerol lipase
LKIQPMRFFVAGALAVFLSGCGSVPGALAPLGASQAFPSISVMGAATTNKHNPVIFVPGYLDLPLYFAVLTHHLADEGRQTTTLNLFPNVGDITVAATALAKEVQQVKAQTGASKVDLVGHSMGGLIARYYLKNLNGAVNIAHLVQFSSPNHGTLISYLGPGSGADEMHPGSVFLNALNAGSETPDNYKSTPGGIRYTSIRGGLDEIVIPHDSPILEGAANFLVPTAMHGSILISPTAMSEMDGGLAGGS